MKPKENKLTLGQYCAQNRMAGMSLEDAAEVKKIALRMLKERDVRPTFVKGSGHMRQASKTLNLPEIVWIEAIDELKATRNV